MYQTQLPTYDICLTYSNSVCELLIVRIHNPDLIIILMYRPPSCPAEAFNNIISRSQTLILSMPSPLPNIIMLGDFNFPGIDWTNPDLSCTYVIPFISLSDCLFLNQQVLEHTRKSNILHIIFSLDDFVNSIDVTDSFLSDHCIITVETSIPFCHTPHQSMNRSCNDFESLDFKKAVWSGLCSSINLVNWQVRPYDCIASDCLSVIIETLSDLCSIHVPPKCYKNKYVSRFHTERKILMRKRTRLQTTQPTSGGAVTADASCCANCVEPPRPQQWGPDLPFFGHAGHADPLDGWRCCSQKRVMSRPIQVRQL